MYRRELRRFVPLAGLVLAGRAVTAAIYIWQGGPRGEPVKAVGGRLTWRYER